MAYFTWMGEHDPETIMAALTCAIGDEIEWQRRARGWTRAQMVALMPSGVTDRTLLSYEHGTRNMILARFLEICHVLQLPPGRFLEQAATRVRTMLYTAPLTVDLEKLLVDNGSVGRKLRNWTKCHREHGETHHVLPVQAAELAIVCGMSHAKFIRALSRFLQFPTQAAAQVEHERQERAREHETAGADVTGEQT